MEIESAITLNCGCQQLLNVTRTLAHIRSRQDAASFPQLQTHWPSPGAINQAPRLKRRGRGSLLLAWHTQRQDCPQTRLEPPRHQAQSGSTPPLFDRVLRARSLVLLSALSNPVNVLEDVFQVGLGCGGTMRAATLPLRVIPMRSPSPTRSTSSDSFRLASNSPTVRIKTSNDNILDI